MSEVVVTWQDKIPGWQQQSKNWRAEIEAWQVELDEVLADSIPGTITYIDERVQTARARGETTTCFEILCYKDEYSFYRDLSFSLRDRLQTNPNYRTEFLFTFNMAWDPAA